MKVSLFFAFSLLSASALACPNLSGYYSGCRSSTGQLPGREDMTVTQLSQNGVALYRITWINQESQDREEQFVLADGRTYTQEQRDTTSGATVLKQVTASCRQAVLAINDTTIVNRQVVRDVATQLTRAGGILRWVLSGSVMGRRVVDTLICE
jgi:hypothetical protein